MTKVDIPSAWQKLVASIRRKRGVVRTKIQSEREKNREEKLKNLLIAFCDQSQDVLALRILERWQSNLAANRCNSK